MDDSLSEVISKAINLFGKRLGEAAELSLSDIKKDADELIAVSSKVEEVAKIILSMDAASRSLRTTARETKDIIKEMKILASSVEDIQIISSSKVREAAETGTSSVETVSTVEQVTRYNQAVEEAFIAREKAKIEQKSRVLKLQNIYEKQRREQAQAFARAALTDPQMKKTWPIAMLLETAQGIEQGVMRTRADRLFENELIKGPYAKRGGTNIGDYTPLYEEFNEGEWMPSDFYGQAGLAVGSKQSSQFLIQELLGEYGLSESDKVSRSPTWLVKYNNIRKAIEENASILGTGLMGVTGGIDLETGGLSLGVISRMKATPSNIETMKNLKEDIQAYLEMIRGSSGYSKLYGNVIEQVLAREAGMSDEEQDLIQRQYRNVGPNLVHRFPVSTEGRIIDESYSGEGEIDDIIKIMRINANRRDVLTPGETGFKSMRGMIEETFRNVTLNKKQIPPEFVNAGVDDPDKFRQFMIDVVKAWARGEHLTEGYAGTSVSVDPITGMFGGGEVYLNFGGFGKQRGTVLQTIGKDYIRQHTDEEKALIALQYGPEVFKQMAMRDPSLIEGVQALTNTTRFTSGTFSGRKSTLSGGEVIDVDKGMGIPSRPRGASFLSDITVPVGVEGAAEIIIEQVLNGIRPEIDKLSDAVLTITEALLKHGYSDSEIDETLKEIERFTRGGGKRTR